jgi:hypothetical protein
LPDGAPDKGTGLTPEPPGTGGDAEPQGAALATIKTLAFIVLIQVFALAITKVNAPITEAVGPVYEPAGPSSGGSIVNVLILVAFVFATTVTAVWLARKRKVRVFMAMIFGGTAVALFLLTLLATTSLTANMNPNVSLYLSLAFGTATVVLLSLIALRKVPASFALVLTGLLSAEVGSYFATAIPILTAILLPLGFSLYDIYTVFRGPLKTLINTLPDESLTTMASSIGGFSIGTGDTVFYAMVPALGYYTFGFSSAFLAILAVDAGVVVTLYLLSKSKLLPGLPIPMGLGVAVLLAFYLR